MKWQPIETAPKYWIDVMLFDPNEKKNGGVSQGYCGQEAGGERWVSCYFRSCKPTHWMPIPAPPE